jgi:tRNA G18 (ribose-2'-O)-methylase SpoU
MPSGYFGIGIENSKTPMNIGTLWRSAYVFDAAMLFTINRRYEKQCSDNIRAVNHLPLQHFATFEEFYSALPYSCQLVGVEIDPRAKILRKFCHPDRAIYLLGAEDNGLSKRALEKCHHVIQLPGKMSVNVAVAGSIVMCHRIMQREREETLWKQRVMKFRGPALGLEGGTDGN